MNTITMLSRLSHKHNWLIILIAFLLAGCTSVIVDTNATVSSAIQQTLTSLPTFPASPTYIQTTEITPTSSLTKTLEPSSTPSQTKTALPSKTKTPPANLELLSPSNSESIIQLSKVLVDLGSMAISPDSNSLAGVNREGILFFWDIRDPSLPTIISSLEIPRFTRLGMGTFDAEYKPDGTSLAIGTAENTILSIDTSSHKSVVDSWGPAVVMNVSFSPNGKYFAASGADGIVRIWETEHNSLIFETQAHHLWAWGLDFSPDSRWLASGSAFDGLIKIWDIESSQEIKTLNDDEDRHTYDLAFSPDGSYLLAGGCNLVFPDPSVAICGDAFVALWHLPEFQYLSIDYKTLSTVTSVAFSPDNKLFATGMEDGRIWLWDTETHQAIKLLSGHTAKIDHLLFGENGKIMVSVGNDNAFRLWGIIKD